MLNKNRFTKGLMILAFILMVFSLTTDANAAEPAALNVDAKSAILVEASTGKILYGLNEDQPLPPASMTKMMTEYLVLEAVANKEISWDDVVTISDYGFYMGRYGGSRVYLNENEERTVRELYMAMVIYSANDATVTLAEHIAGSEEKFVNMMNEKANEFGMGNTHFVTSTGYPKSGLGEFAPNISGEQLMTARDAAILAKQLITDYPEVLEASSVPKAIFREGEDNPINMLNWNWMLPGLWYEMEGVDGLKTGHTEKAGYCFTGTAQRDGMRLISVVMGTDSKEERFAVTREILEYGFKNFSMEKVASKSQVVTGIETAPVKMGKELEVPVVVQEDVVLPVRVGENEKFKAQASFLAPKAPIEQGQEMGSVVFSTGQEEYLRPLHQEQAGTKLVAAEPVKKAGIITRFFRGIKSFFSELFKLA